jgi:predicted molibdopterin-dependent oxidoreductase YjgC
MIIRDIARNMDAKGFDFNSAEEIMGEIRQLVPSYGGVKYKRLENGGVQWPCPYPLYPGTPYLYGERFNTPTGRAKLTPVVYKPSAEATSNEYPFILTTRRSTFHYHGVLSRKVEGLNELRGEEHVEINPIDAASLEIQNGEVVIVSSRRGSVKAKAKITKVVPPGVVSMTFHYAETRTNLLTSTALDPIAKIPELKVCAVKIEREESAYIGKEYLRWGRGKKR